MRATTAYVLATRPPHYFDDVFYGDPDPRLHPLVAVSVGYFLWDAGVCALHRCAPAFWAHAWACLLVFAFALHPVFLPMAPLFLLRELSTPFLNARGVLLLLKRTDTALCASRGKQRLIAADSFMFQTQWDPEYVSKRYQQYTLEHVHLREAWVAVLEQMNDSDASLINSAQKWDVGVLPMPAAVHHTKGALLTEDVADQRFFFRCKVAGREWHLYGSAGAWKCVNVSGTVHDVTGGTAPCAALTPAGN